MNCSISCDQRAILSLEAESTKKVVDRRNNWKVFELSDVQEDHMLLCISMCHSEVTVASMDLTVYCEWLGPGPGLGRLGGGGGQGWKEGADFGRVGSEEAFSPLSRGMGYLA